MILMGKLACWASFHDSPPPFPHEALAGRGVPSSSQDRRRIFLFERFSSEEICMTAQAVMRWREAVHQ